MKVESIAECILQYFWPALSGLENQILVFLGATVLHRFYCMHVQWDIFLQSFNANLIKIKKNFANSKFWCMFINFAKCLDPDKCFCCCLLTFFKLIYFTTKFFQDRYQSVKHFESRSGTTLCPSWSGSKLFAKVINGWQKSLLARKSSKHHFQQQNVPSIFGWNLHFSTDLVCFLNRIISFLL